MHRVAAPGVQRRAAALRVAKTVLAAFVGIRARAGHEHDAPAASPLALVVAGVLGAALLVAALVVVARIAAG